MTKLSSLPLNERASDSDIEFLSPRGATVLECIRCGNSIRHTQVSAADEINLLDNDIGGLEFGKGGRNLEAVGAGGVRNEG